MSLAVDLQVNCDINDHQYRVYIPDLSTPWLEELAKEYVKVRSACVVGLQAISFEGLEMNVAELQKRIERATVPHYQGGNFNVVRSDFGELISYILLENLFGTRIAVKSLCTRELRDHPARGIDGIGIEQGNKLTIVISEVKVSDSSSSPPSLVDSSDDSLRKQHLHHIRQYQVTATKIMDKARDIYDVDLRDLYLTAALILENGPSPNLCVVVSSVLIRPLTKHTISDFGTFFSQPTDFEPAKIRFMIFCVHKDIDPLMREWDQLIRQVIQTP